MSSQRTTEKPQADRLQLIIAEILKDDENKYCADCDGKGPRWASWNLGVLLCIRCAGIHRGLGVHISKVKSLNLDSWELQQVAMLKAVGNRRGRLLYEANLPDFFRRPQTDSALEQFIRSKYEQKRFVANDFIPPKPDIDSLKLELARLDQHNKKRAPTTKAFNLSLQNGDATKSQKPTLKSMTKPTATKAGEIHRISSPPSSNAASPVHSNDLIALKIPPHEPSATTSIAQESASSQFKSAAPTAFSSDLLGLQLGASVQSSDGPSSAAGIFASDSPRAAGAGGNENPTTKESIMALYALSKPPATQLNGASQLSTQQNQTNPCFGMTTALPNQAPPTYMTQQQFDWANSASGTNLQNPASNTFGFNALQSAGHSNWGNFTTGSQFVPASKPDTFSDLHWGSGISPAPVQPQRTQQPASTASQSVFEPSYLAQIQNQLASMQVRSGVLE